MFEKFDNNFEIIFDKEHDDGFHIGINPIIIHRHSAISKLHFHFSISLFLWFIEIRIGRDVYIEK